MQHRNLLLFFPSTFSSVTEFFLSSSCTVVYYVSGPFWLAADWDLPLESSSNGTDLGLFEHCYFHHFVCVRPPIWSRITISLHGGRRKKLHASNVVKSHFWIPWCENEKQSHMIYGKCVLLCLSSREVTSSNLDSMWHHLGICAIIRNYKWHTVHQTAGHHIHHPPLESHTITLPLIKEREVFC